MTDYRMTIVAAYPRFANSQLKVLTHSWDSVAVDVDNEFIFKFPKNAKAELALRMEYKLLRHIRPRVTIAVPDMTLHNGPPLFSIHGKIQGEHLEKFDTLSENAKVRLALELGNFYAQLHRLDQTTMKHLGAMRLPSWGNPDEIFQRCLVRLPNSLHKFAEMTCVAFSKLPPDPYGSTYGYFDGHGWNMAFDHTTETLNGMYDFADSGIGPLHQEFVYASLTSHELSERVIVAYENATGHVLDRQRINTLASMHRLWELSEHGVDEAGIAEKVERVNACAQ
jgi:Ser/Thr protein kinase RdoA (MazF antagonist)